MSTNHDETRQEGKDVCTHEHFIHAVQGLAIAHAPEARDKLEAIKLVYGAGQAGLRGVTYYNRWQAGEQERPFVEVCALGQENWVQLAGTTIHELAHVLAGHGAGHGPQWKAACETLGLRRARAAGHVYRMAGFAPSIRFALATMPKPDDGAPVASLAGLGINVARLKPCPAGIGTRGGQSRGTGSGSRLRRFVCDCEPPVIVRVARDVFEAHCDCCNGAFHQ
jgi:hypothetical protein